MPSAPELPLGTLLRLRSRRKCSGFCLGHTKLMLRGYSKPQCWETLLAVFGGPWNARDQTLASFELFLALGTFFKGVLGIESRPSNIEAIKKKFFFPPVSLK